MWFNPGEISKNKADTLATFATPATLEAENSKTEGESRKVAEVAEVSSPENLIVTCYTPNGKPIEVEARDREHAAWLIRMNPKRTENTHTNG